MRAILVSVDYSDFISITIPYNRHHFTDIMVVTTLSDKDSIRVALTNRCWVYTTDAFYDDGADFNKFKALELALDYFGRYGWMCIMDGDVLWPKTIPSFSREVGKLYGPRRHLFYDWPGPIPPEDEWASYKLHPAEAEFAGYSQIFHADDPHLGPPPWHETNWRHAGGGDSFFQMKWDGREKKRTPFNVLHLGKPGLNWVGRSVPYLDGSLPENSQENISKLQQYRSNRGKVKGDKFFHEKL